ncbi:MAG: hypothetical protein NPIRA05_12250 [Nitrospirales bacterium]|nr:MAG: hypothetical protein NPIRA05_12250 [Nitrospirales bacterium]
MKFCQRPLGREIVIGVLVVSLWGCVSTPSPRMPAVFGLSRDKAAVTVTPLVQWSAYQTLGLVIHSDSTGSGAAPAISSPLLSTLSERIQAYLRQHCAISEVKHIPRHEIEWGSFSSLLNAAQKYQVEAVLVALFSSTESMQADTFGEERMMTHMPGTTTSSMALVELALVNVEQGAIVHSVDKTAVEHMDRLTVPIGQDQGTLEEALDILRANSGQQALDDALQDLTHGCAAG